MNTDYFGETTRHFYLTIHDAWNVYRAEQELEWTAIVPAARMQTHLPYRGTYRVRTDEQLVTTDSKSRRYFDVSQISYVDCACAMLDEAEQHRYARRFVSVGY